MTRSAIALTAGAAFFLSACGTDPGNRAASGAGIGAGAGAVIGAVTGLSILEGALLGAAAGGLTGGLTDADFLNLGDPIWASSEKPANQAAVSRVQAGLMKLGYDPGPIDGVKGGKTTQAIQAYQRDNGLLVDGRASHELAAHIDRKLQQS
jgi:peptidoglycan hydrolase-like protein with peptidoglycan-binding domain